jgi:pilus assembly protein CpaE
MIAGAEAALSGAAGGASVPRIGLHNFCELPETRQIAEQAAADRRMARATTEILQGGLAGAVANYQNQPTPSLIIVESQDEAQVLIGQLDQLAEVCDPGTKVIIVGRANDIALYRELMRRGVSEYLVPPLNPLQLIESVTTLYSDPSAPFIGRSIAFVGAKGGTGASTVAHNFAHVLTEHMQTNAVIVDFDLPFGTAGLDFNQDPLQGVADALSQPDRLDPVLLDRMMARCTDRLSLFASPATLDDDYDISPEAFQEVVAKIRTTAPFVILDLPHLWSGWMRRMLLSSDEVVIVATPDLAALRNAKNMVDLVRLSRPNDAPPRLVLNQVGVTGRPEIPVKDFGEAIGLDPSLVLAFDPKLFGQAANNGQMVSEVNGKSKAVEGLGQLAQLITRREPPPAPKKSMFASLFKGK